MMVKIAVFDSGVGSLSVIRAIQKVTNAEIIYFADQANFPYGKKTKYQLNSIIQKTVKKLQTDFAPDLIILASNTPSLVLNLDKSIIGVYPPLRTAAEISVTGNIAILGTSLAVGSTELDRYITQQRLPKDVTIHKVDVSELVELAETGMFLTEVNLCRKNIKILVKRFKDDNIDVATLSSTHLTFLREHLESELDGVRFLDPADVIAASVAERIKTRHGQNTLRIYASGDVKKFKDKLAKLGIRDKIKHFTV